jgi:hypothetical protein
MGNYYGPHIKAKLQAERAARKRKRDEALMRSITASAAKPVDKPCGNRKCGNRITSESKSMVMVRFPWYPCCSEACFERWRAYKR